MTPAAQATFVVHTAAPPRGLVQQCLSCGWPLMDAAAWVEGRVAVCDGGPPWWPVGARIATGAATPGDGGFSYVVAGDRPLDGDERMCPGAN